MSSTTTKITVNGITIRITEPNGSGEGYTVKCGTKAVFHTWAARAQSFIEESISTLRGQVQVQLEFDEKDLHYYTNIVPTPKSFTTTANKLREAVSNLKYSCLSAVIHQMAGV